MKYIFDFIKIISFTGWVVYLIKFMLEDYMEYKLFACIWVVIFTMIFQFVNMVEFWLKNK